MIPLSPHDVRWSVARLPRRVAGLLAALGSRALVGGGHVRASIAKEEGSDVDVFVRDQATADVLVDKLGEPDFETQFAFTYFGDHAPIQVVHYWHFKTPDELLEHFDFTVTQAVIWRDRSAWAGRCSEHFYPDLAARRLVYTQHEGRPPLEAGGTLLRLLRYAGKGYTAPLTTLAQVASEAVAANGTCEDLMESLLGIDPADRWPEWVAGVTDNGSDEDEATP